MILIWSNIRILVIILSGAAHINVCWMQSSIWAVGQNHNFLEFFPPLILMIALSKHQYERWVDLTAKPLNCSYWWYPYEPGFWCTINVTCIPLSKICDGRFDCHDYYKADERQACNLYPTTGKIKVFSLKKRLSIKFDTFSLGHLMKICNHKNCGNSKSTT